MTISAAALYRLKSDARRGLLENDLILERFFRRYADTLTEEQGAVLTQLLALSDNDLMDLLIGRVDTVAALGDVCSTPAFLALLGCLREKQ
jgi:antitoxin CptB